MLGAVHGAGAALPYMIAQRLGVLVGVDSAVGRTATTVVEQLRRPRLEVVAGARSRQR